MLQDGPQKQCYVGGYNLDFLGGEKTRVLHFFRPFIRAYLKKVL